MGFWDSIGSFFSSIFGEPDDLKIPPVAVPVRGVPTPARGTPTPVPTITVPPGQFLVGDGTWPWRAQIDGPDIVLYNVRATAFGGDSDAGDNGETASGYNTKGHPGLIGCALPMRDDRLSSLRGSPIPKMPFGIHSNGEDNPIGAHVDVTFLDTGLVVKSVPVVDLGPAKSSGNALDCSVALAKRNTPGATANNFSARVNVRILGGAKWAAV